MAGQWYKSRGRLVRCVLIAFLVYVTSLTLGTLSTSLTTSKSSQSVTALGPQRQLVDQSESAVMARLGSMKSALLALASSSLAAGQNASSYAGSATGSPTTNSVITATIDGTATTFSNAFTVPASADIGPNLLPNVQDPHAVQAQDVCPGYTASDVEKTATGFSAILTLAGAPVSTRKSLVREHRC